jgi:hypothetical protein
VQKKKVAKIVDARFLENGDVRLTFTRPHGVLRAGQIMELHNGTHDVVSVEGKFILTARKWAWYKPYLIRGRVIWRMIAGRPKASRPRWWQTLMGKITSSI